MKLSEIQELMQLFANSQITKMELQEKDVCLKLEKQAQGSNHQISEPVSPVSIETDKEKEIEEGTWVKAPLVGTFYAGRSADGKPFVEVGQKVKQGDVLCIIEAMKVMNEIRAPKDGIVRSILITNASMVEYDQNMIRLGDAS